MANLESPTQPTSPNILRSIASPRSFRPDSSLSPYMSPVHQHPAGQENTNRIGKGKHISTIKSLGLLHELHEYIQSVETLAAEQKRELERVKDEKKELERVVYRVEFKQERGAYGDLFNNAEIADMPPRLRAVLEDSKGLKDKVKKYKLRATALEQQNTQLQNQVLALTEAQAKLRSQLAECSRTPTDVEQEASLKSKLVDRDTQVINLEHNVAILKSKAETDAKLAKSALAQAAKEKEALKCQLVQAHKALEDREKDIRALQIDVRKAMRKAAPTRASIAAAMRNACAVDDGGTCQDDPATQPVAAASGSHVPVADMNAGHQVPSPPLAMRPDDKEVHVMLVIVTDDPGASPTAPVPPPLKQPATGISPALDPPPKHQHEPHHILQEASLHMTPGGEQQQEQQEQQQEEAAADDTAGAAAAEGAGLPADGAAHADSHDGAAVSSPAQGDTTTAALQEGDLGMMGAVAVEEGPWGRRQTSAASSHHSAGATPDAQQLPAGVTGDSENIAAAQDEAARAMEATEGERSHAQVLYREDGGGDHQEQETPQPDTSAAGGSALSHASAPVPVPYSRTAARSGARGSATVGAAGSSRQAKPTPAPPAGHSNGPGGAGVGGVKGAASRRGPSMAGPKHSSAAPSNATSRKSLAAPA